MKNYNITPELMEEAGKVKSLEELMELSKNHQLELTKEDAEKFLASLEKTKNEGEISDEELDNVAGGGACDESSYGKPTCPDFYGSTTANLEKYKATCGGCTHWDQWRNVCNRSNPRFNPPTK